MQNHRHIILLFMMGFRLWDNTHHRIIKIRYVVFNEKSLYKDRLQVKEDDSKFVDLDDVSENSVQKIHDEVKEPQTPPQYPSQNVQQ